MESKDVEAEPSTGPVTDAEEADAIRKVVFGYWEAFNAYDPDRALSYLEVEYRQQRDKVVRDDIKRMRPFRVRLGVAEESPPAIVGPDQREMYLTMTEPLGVRRIHMVARKVEGEWKLTRTEEVK